MEPLMSFYETTVGLGQAMFGHADLGDRRRATRLARTFDQMRRHPGGSLPDKLASPADLKALYRLCASPAVTHQAVIASMRNYTLGRIAKLDGPVLILHDATELDYTSHESLEKDLGQIGKGDHSGYICHNVIAVDPINGEALGVLDQILHCRDEVPPNETLTQRRNRDSRESLLWVHGTANLPGNRHLVDVADQGASTFEFLEHESKSTRRFVIRNGQVRKVYAGHEPVGQQAYLEDHIASLSELGRFTMDVQAQKGRQARVDAEFAVRGGPILLMPPHARYGHHGNQPLPMYVVHVLEVSPPPDEEQPIHWTLLTNEPIHNFDDAWRVVGWYERRWVVEEYHKALKTGCRVEDLQFTAVERLQPAIALISAVALTLLNLRDASRRPDATTRRADTLLGLEYIETLSIWRHGQPFPDWTIHDFFFALARLGGHQNRKHDHRPGWLILWRGWTKLQDKLDGYLAAQHKQCGRT
jgi:hypothetical protein